MAPLMGDGDVVIVRRQAAADTGDVAIVLINGSDATVKKIKRSVGGVTLVPLNPAYEPVYYSVDDCARLPVTIIGKVIEVRKKL